MLDNPLVLLVIAAAIAVAVGATFSVAQRRRISAIQAQMSNLGADSKIRYDVDNVLRDLDALRTTPQRLDEYKARLEKAHDDLNALQVNLPHANEVVQIQENMRRLCTDFGEHRTAVDEQFQKFAKSASEDIHAAKEQVLSDAMERITKLKDENLLANTVSRDEFEQFKAQVEKSLGADEVAERMTTLSTIFDSAQIKTLNWQCKLISLLRGGLAPDAEQDVMVANGIPQSSFSKFLKKLEQNNIIEKKSISAYYMTPDYEWIYGYTENTDWLQRRLSSSVKKERNYQDHIKDNLEQLEEGLRLVSTEYELATGRIDIMCTDSHGRRVGVELKYPAASTSDFRQITGYRRDFIEKTGREDSRFFIVAPKIPQELRELAESDNIEWREVAF